MKLLLAVALSAALLFTGCYYYAGQAGTNPAASAKRATIKLIRNNGYGTPLWVRCQLQVIPGRRSVVCRGAGRWYDGVKRGTAIYRVVKGQVRLVSFRFG